MQSIPSISPLNPITAILPLFFVVGISMTREGVEDYFRNKSDLRANSTPTKALRNGKFVEVRADEVVIGDIVFVENDAMFPADLVLLATSNPEG